MSGLFGDITADEALPTPPAEGGGLFGDPGPVEPQKAAAYRVLARKYRPTGFPDLIGQEVMVRTLRNAFALGRIAHAFMLTGVRGVGKTTTARIIARALNCVGPDGKGGPTPDPCGVCANCVAILADRHPDVMEMDAASNTGVDDVREIIDATRFKPMQARTKVFIVDEIHMLSRNAFNALLKTLEEPPPHIKFVFATTEIRKVPITVLSRCQRFDLRRISIAELSGLFTRIAGTEGVAVSPGAIDLIARAADGSARDGLSLLDQAIARVDGAEVTADEVTDMLGLAGRSLVFDLMDALMAGDPAAALAITDRAHAHGADLGLMLNDLLELVHTLTRLKSAPALRDGQGLPEAERTRGAALADRLSIPTLGRAWQMLLRGSQEVEQASDRRAAAEMVLIRLCHVAELPPPGELMRRLTAEGADARVPVAVQPTVAQPGPQPSSQPGSSNGGGTRAVANGAPALQAAPEVAAAPTPPVLARPVLSSFRDVAALVAERREPMLHSYLLHAVHLVRFAPGVIELRPEPDAPRDLASRLGALLQDATGTRWTIALSTSPGEATLAAQGVAADAARRHVAAQHPLVLAIMEAFPGARMQAVHDSTADAYGLPTETLAEPEGFDFAPPDADAAEFMEDDR